MSSDSTSTTLPASSAQHDEKGAKLERAEVRGKFLYAGDEKIYLRGVTYGPFRPHPDGAPHAGSEYHTPEVVADDFAAMRATGINSVRLYTVPPRWLLDQAAHQGLRVLVGLPWEQHVAFLDAPGLAADIERRSREGVRACAGHEALLGFAVGNEIPASIVRWHGPRRVEGFIERLCRAVKSEDPQALVTYVSFPTTEYLSLPFVDFVSFNVYLEEPEALAAYLARLQTLAGARPLVMAELGLDSRRNGEDAQAVSLGWQLRAAFESGAAGAFAFKWTDEWHRGGHDIEDWDFGLTDRARAPKPALAAVEAIYAEVPMPADAGWPRISVVVCSYNGAATLAETLAALRHLAYPDYEVIVVDDGSTDDTAALAEAAGVRLIRTENRGLSAARNTGAEAATGAVVAYLDADAYPDPDWLTYLAEAFTRDGYGAVGGPNLPPRGDGLMAACVSRSPGNPTHVLLTDREAEHLPGCNLAVRKDALETIGGFDTQFRIAGDDVDLCWSLREAGYTLGFAPGAVVWHHRRRTFGTYWSQQKNYGRAEAFLEDKWPQKYNWLGHLGWRGSIYGEGQARPLALRRWRIYHGVWGTGLFQSIYEPATRSPLTLVLMPEWYLVILLLAAFAAMGVLWAPVFWLATPLCAVAVGALVGQALYSARGAQPRALGAENQGLTPMLLTAGLHLAQPLARLIGRLACGLRPWRRKRQHGLAIPLPRTVSLWSETWVDPTARLSQVEEALRERDVRVQRGGVFDRWDLEIRSGLLGSVRLLQGTEEHGAGKQLTQFRLRPRLGKVAVFLVVLKGAMAVGAFAVEAVAAGAALLGGGSLVLVYAALDVAAASGAAEHALHDLDLLPVDAR